LLILSQGQSGLLAWLERCKDQHVVMKPPAKDRPGLVLEEGSLSGAEKIRLLLKGET
jgi:hypothetical protein